MGIGNLKKKSPEPEDQLPDPAEVAESAPAEPSASVAAVAETRPAPQAVRPVPAAPAPANNFDDDLASIDAADAEVATPAEPARAGAAEVAPVPASAAAEAVAKAPVRDMGAMLAEKLGELGVPASEQRSAPSLPKPIRVPPARQAEEDGPAAGEDASERAATLVDGRPDAGGPSLGDDASVDPAEASLPDPQPVQEAQPALVRTADNNVKILETLLASGGTPDEEISRLGEEWLSYLNSKEPENRKLTAKEKLLADEQERERDQEAARGGYGGGLFSVLGSLLSLDPRAPRSVEGARKRFEGSLNAKADDIRTRMYDVKLRQYAERMTSLNAHFDDLCRSVNRYNEFFVDSEAAAPFKAEIVRFMQAEGLDRNQAMARIASGDVPDSLKSSLAQVKAAVGQDPDVVAARVRMEAAEERIAETARRAARDSDIITRNFHDREDARWKEGQSRSGELLREGLIEMSEKAPKPLGEEEGRKRLQERMRELADSIHAMVDRIVQAVASSKLASFMPSR